MRAVRPDAGILLWWALCLALACPAWWIGPVPLDQPTSTWTPLAQSWALHPDAGLRQPAWTWWSTAWLHGSALHLARNLMALGLIALLGTACRVSVTSAVIWALVWPLTQLGMLAQPEWHTYIGLSGVLHGGVAVIAMQQIGNNKTNPLKYVGWALLLGLVFKILMENPWQHPLIQTIGSDITVAPWAHLSGTTSGIALYLISSVTKHLRRVTRLTPARRTLD